jgi:hypothetical protein
MKRDKTIFIAICIAIFVSIAIVAYNFITGASKTMSGRGYVEDVKEGFDTPIIRAADCNCLPGYIPSNSIKGRILGKQGEFITVGSPTLVRYGTESKWVEKTVDKNFQATNDFFGSDPAPGLHKHVETVPSTSTDYFCRSLSEPEKRRPCY